MIIFKTTCPPRIRKGKFRINAVVSFFDGGSISWNYYLAFKLDDGYDHGYNKKNSSNIIIKRETIIIYLNRPNYLEMN
jgi:hypothetical protein